MPQLKEYSKTKINYHILHTHIFFLAPISMVNEDDMLGLIIITVVCCAVGTSIVWVVIIYQTRQRLNASHNANRQSLSRVVSSAPEMQTQSYLDTSSQHSKDSGTGDSTNPSNDQLELCLPGKIILFSRFVGMILLQ